MLQCGLLVAVCAVPLAGRDTPQVGYVDCLSRNKNTATPVFSNPCISKPVDSMTCGEKVEVLGREGPWFRIASADGGERYVGVSSVSQKKNRFVALDFPAPSQPYTRDCSAFEPITSEVRPQTGKVPPRPTYAPRPEYSIQALRAGIRGSIKLVLTIGTDGRVHEIQALNRLGYGLDEKAVETVQSWKFEPALQDGTPIETKLAAEISFNQ